MIWQSSDGSLEGVSGQRLLGDCEPLLAYKSGSDVALHWGEAAPDILFNVHRTTDKTRLGAFPAGIGSEPIVATVADERRVSLAGELAGAELAYYAVHDRDPLSGESRF